MMPLIYGCEEAEERIETAKNGIADYDRYINGAYVTVNTAPKNCGNYITVDVVTALKARVALQMDDYENAAKYAGDLVNSNRYPLSNTATDFESVWKNDKGTETIWQIAMTPVSRSAHTPQVRENYYRFAVRTETDS